MATWGKRIATNLRSSERTWPVVLALFTIAGLYAALPSKLVSFDDWRLTWAPIAMVVILAGVLVFSHRKNLHRLNENSAYVLLGFLTACMAFSLIRLVDGALHNQLNSGELLRAAGLLWGTNILVFSCWYWRLDAGGPIKRAKRERHERGAFLFPQLTMSPELLEMTDQANWKPDYLDYLFLAFNSSTALSPTDSAVLSRWAKLLMMTQSLISIIIIVLLAARAVNILGT